MSAFLKPRREQLRISGRERIKGNAHFKAVLEKQKISWQKFLKAKLGYQKVDLKKCLSAILETEVSEITLLIN